MVKVKVVNPESDYAGKIATVTLQDWQSGSFWVPLTIVGHHAMIARHALREL